MAKIKLVRGVHGRTKRYMAFKDVELEQAPQRGWYLRGDLFPTRLESNAVRVDMIEQDVDTNEIHVWVDGDEAGLMGDEVLAQAVLDHQGRGWTVVPVEN